MTKSRPSNALPLSIKVNDHLFSNPEDIRRAFNQHFAEAGHLFDKLFPGLPPTGIANNNSPASRVPLFSFQPFTSFEVLKALESIDTKSSIGEDLLDPYCIRLAAPIISEPLSYIFNLSISTGTFPRLWKSARVIPLHKGGDRDNLDNYRPISTLPVLAKVLETLVNSQLKCFLSSHSVLSPLQSGFRPMHSTTSAITLVTSDIVSALDDQQHCATLFIDLSKAFDTVDHHLLLERLSGIGLDTAACAWFRDYLSLRRQCIKSPLGNSDFLTVTKGVPQGSVLGPVLFTIYINELVSSLSGCHAHLYADDTILYCISDSPLAATAKLQLGFNLLQHALAELKLVLNSGKTKFMLFSRARNIDHSSLHISTVDGSSIERVTEYKYLGIWLDEQLSFKTHISCLATKLRQKVGFLYRNRSSFPMISRKRVVEAVFLSVLDFGDVIYRHAAASTLKQLDSVYHSALRFITGDSYDTHHCLLYDKVGWPSLTLRRNYHWYRFIFKAISGKLPPYISSLLELNSGTYNTRSSNFLTFNVPLARTDLGNKAFFIDAPKTWNALQQTLHLEVLPSETVFKQLASDLCTSNCDCF